MSINKNSDSQHATNENGKKLVGTPENTARFGIGDYVQVHIHLKDQVFCDFPHGDTAIVVALHHEDDEYFYHLPVIQLEKELRMFNPDHLIVVQRADGSPGETAKLKAANEATAAQKAKNAAEKQA